MTPSSRQSAATWAHDQPVPTPSSLLAIPRYDVALAFCLVLVVGLARVGWLALQSDARLVTMVPDDAFYYIVLAQNFAAAGGWTFDGVAPATGFHLLWGYLLAGVQWALGNPDWRGLFLTGAALSAVAVAGAAGLVAATARRSFGPAGALGATFAFLSFAGAQQATLLVEAPFVILIAAALIALTLRRDVPADGGTLLAAFALGFAGMMARSDFGLLPLGVLAGHGLAHLARLERRAALLAPAAALAGAVAGLAAVLAHAYAISGVGLQASADIKHHWSALAGHPLGNGLTILVQTLLPVVVPVAARWVLLALVLAAAVCAAMSRRHWPDRGAGTVFGLAMAGTVAAYLFYFRYNSQALQIWYAANLLVPTAFVLGGAFAAFFGRLRPFGLAALGLTIVLCLAFSTRPVWPWQASLREAGLFLREHPEVDPVGSWNAGIIAYFAGRPVINLDGLVNDDVVPAIKAGDMTGYLQRRGVRYLVDGGEMFEGRKLARGGYADGRLAGCIRDRKPLAAPIPPHEARAPILFTLDPACL